MSAILRPTLLFLPGTLCSARVWHHQFAALRDEWPCMHVDYAFETSIAAMAAKALACASGMLIPIGLSMGGIVALEMWRQASARIAAMALFDTDAGADDAGRRQRRDAQIHHALTYAPDGLGQIAESTLAPSYFAATDKLSASLTKEVVAMALAQGVDALIAQSAALATRHNMLPHLRNIHQPTLVACGATDRICSPASHAHMAEQLPRATLRIVPLAGHLAPFEQPDASTHVLKTWLDGLSHTETAVRRATIDG